MADANVIRAFKKAIRVKNASPREAKALFEAGLTESGLRNLRYGDKDSLGSLQERTSIYGAQHALDPYASAIRFLDSVQKTNRAGFNGSAGQLAQSAQRSAFPGRYDQQGQAAARFLAGQKLSSPGGTTTTRTSTTSITPQAARNQRSALAAFVLAGPKADPVKLATNYAQLGKQTQTTTKVSRSSTPAVKAPAAPVSGKAGVAKFAGKPVAGWIEPILAYARQHGWKGSVTSGYRSFADQQRIYASGVRPAAKPGTSNHEFTAFPGGAVDVTDAAQLSAILRSSPYAKKLVWAGGKDPVHFSHPSPNGSY